MGSYVEDRGKHELFEADWHLLGCLASQRGVLPQVVAQVVAEPEVGPSRFDGPRFGNLPREIFHHQMVWRAASLLSAPPAKTAAAMPIERVPSKQQRVRKQELTYEAQLT